MGQQLRTRFNTNCLLAWDETISIRTLNDFDVYFWQLLFGGANVATAAFQAASASLQENGWEYYGENLLPGSSTTPNLVMYNTTGGELWKP